MAKRLKSMGNTNYRNGFSVTFHPQMLERPLMWKKSHLIFVNSMSDLFHEDISLEIIKDIVDVMKTANWHQFQILTKRSTRLIEISKFINWPENVWLGVSVESQKYIHRINDIRKVDVKMRFISFEPLIGEVQNINLDGIGWAIVGGESGPGARPMDKKWVIRIRDLCLLNNVPFFFKQWGGVRKKENGRTLDGIIWNQFPSSKFRYLPGA
jgi:protein gp37